MLMARDTFKAPHGVVLKPAPESLFEADEVLPAHDQAVDPDPIPEYKTSESEWLQIPQYKFETYPFDGTPVYATSDGQDCHEAVWRTTRSFDTKICTWKSVGFWSLRNAGGQKLGFEPRGYRELKR
jgi:hypothetical protein